MFQERPIEPSALNPTNPEKAKDFVFDSDAKSLLKFILYRYFDNIQTHESNPILVDFFVLLASDTVYSDQKMREEYENLIHRIQDILSDEQFDSAENILIKIRNKIFPKTSKQKPKNQLETGLPPFSTLLSEVQARLELGDVNYTRERVLSLVATGNEVWYQSSPFEAHGDRFIMLNALKVVIEKAAQQEGSTIPQVCFSKQGIDLGSVISVTTMQLTRQQKWKDVDSRQYVFARWYEYFAQILGVSKPLDDEYAVPVPINIDDPKQVFSGYDRDKVET